MDNAAFHKSEETRKIIHSAGCELLYLPPYSPDLNPIEIFWANFKKKVATLITQLESLPMAIDYAFLLFLSQLE
jgi:transposase